MKRLILLLIMMLSVVIGHTTELKRDGWNLIAVCQDMDRNQINMTGLEEIQAQDGRSIYTGMFEGYTNLEFLEAGYAYWVKGAMHENFESGEHLGKLVKPLKRAGWSLMAACDNRFIDQIDMRDILEIQSQDGDTHYRDDPDTSNLDILKKGYGFWVKGNLGSPWVAKAESNSSVFGDFSGKIYVANEGAGGGGGTTIFEVDTNGTATLLADGFVGPSGLAVDGTVALYISDDRDQIYRLLPDGNFSVLPIDSSYLGNPNGLAIDSYGYLLIANAGSGTIVRVDTDNTSDIQIIAEGFNTPQAVDIYGDMAYFSDFSNNIYEVNVTTTTPVTPVDSLYKDMSSYVAGTQGGLMSDFNGSLFISSYDTGEVFKVDPDGNVTTIFSYPGTQPRGLLYMDGILYITIYNQESIVRVDVESLDYEIFSDSSMASQPYSGPFGIRHSLVDYPTFDGSDTEGNGTEPEGNFTDFGGQLYVTNEGAGGGGGTTIFRVDSDGVATQIADGFVGPSGLVVDGTEALYISDDRNQVYRMIPGGVFTVLPIDSSYLNNPNGLAIDYLTGYLLVANAGSGTIVRVDPDNTSDIEVIAEGFNTPQAVEVYGDMAYFTDFSNAIYEVNISTSTPATPSGSLYKDMSGYVIGTQGGLMSDMNGSLFVSSYDSGEVFKVDQDRNVTTVYSNPGSQPRGLLYWDEMLYITLYNEGSIIRVNTNTLANEVFSDSSMSAQPYSGPFGIRHSNVDYPTFSGTP